MMIRVTRTEAYWELRSRLSQTDKVMAGETAWRLLTRSTPGAHRPAWDVVPHGWKEHE